jgi:glycyl-tRNA synthetase
MVMPDNVKRIDILDMLARRRGFWWPSSEIYGSIAGLYDYGPVGLSLRRRWEDVWRRWFLNEDDVYEIDSAIIMPEPVFVASGHLANFVDPTVKCTKCGAFNRADHIMEDFLKSSFEGMTPQQLTEVVRKNNIRCPSCKGMLGDVDVLNMMFSLQVGPSEGGSRAFLRPETAQGVYVNFRRMFEIGRKSMPIGVAIIGVAYRNEISPRQILTRMREFRQAELQMFFDPDQISVHPKFESVADCLLRLYSVDDRKSGTITEMSCRDVVKKLKLPQFYVYHLAKIQSFYLGLLGIPAERFRFRELSAEERAFYNKIHWDIEIKLDSLESWKEVGGLHYRTDHDLSGHAKISKENLSISLNGKTFVPHVLELSFGVDRNVYALLDIAHTEDSANKRTVLRFPRVLAPYDCGVFPLLERDRLPEKTKEVEKLLKDAGIVSYYDASGSIGRRYRRLDEIGVSLAITCDHKTLEDATVTLRDRDSMKQVRVVIKDLVEKVTAFLQGEDIEKLGKSV